MERVQVPGDTLATVFTVYPLDSIIRGNTASDLDYSFCYSKGKRDEANHEMGSSRLSVAGKPGCDHSWRANGPSR